MKSNWQELDRIAVSKMVRVSELKRMLEHAEKEAATACEAAEAEFTRWQNGTLAKIFENEVTR